ncbi:hypothetical protein, partial [Acidithiobacillus caldus]
AQVRPGSTVRFERLHSNNRSLLAGHPPIDAPKIVKKPLGFPGSNRQLLCRPPANIAIARAAFLRLCSSNTRSGSYLKTGITAAALPENAFPVRAST